MEFALKICHEIYHARKKIKKIYGLPKFKSQEVGMTQIPVDHAPLSTPCHVGLHVHFSTTNVSLDL